MKKVTTFFDKTLLERLKQNPEWFQAFRAALAFNAQVIAFGVDPQLMRRVLPASRCGEGFDIFISGCHKESTALEEAFSQAGRVEACFTLRTNHALMFDLIFYRSSEKEEFAEFFFYFDKEGDPGSATYFLNIDKVGSNDFHFARDAKKRKA